MRRQRTEAHSCNSDRYYQLDRPAGEPRSEHCGRVAALPVSLQRITGQRSGQENQIIECRQLPLRTPAADLIPPDLGHLVDLADDLGREAKAALRARPRKPLPVHMRWRCHVGWLGRKRHVGRHQYFWSFRESKLYSCLADTTLVTSSAEMWPNPATPASSFTTRTSSAPSSANCASEPSDLIFPPT